jgi:hypothetical protein
MAALDQATNADLRLVINTLLRTADKFRRERDRYRRAFLLASAVAFIFWALLVIHALHLIHRGFSLIEWGMAGLLAALALGIIALASGQIARRMK